MCCKKDLKTLQKERKEKWQKAPKMGTRVEVTKIKSTLGMGLLYSGGGTIGGSSKGEILVKRKGRKALKGFNKPYTRNGKKYWRSRLAHMHGC